VAIPIHDDNPTERFALITLLIIAINVFVYFAVQPHDGGQHEASWTYQHAAIPCEIKQDHPLTTGQIASHECDNNRGADYFAHKNIWLAVLESMFFHASILHLAGNMLFLWVFGNNVEDYLGKIGYVIFYLLSGAVAMAAHVLFHLGSTTPVIGASGAIAGVMGMYLVLWPRARVIALVPFFLFLPIPLPAGLLLMMWLVLQFFTPDTGVAWVAHVGGFAFGALVAYLLRKVKPPRNARFFAGGAAPT
jgi:membrane associated rhomboid family serine protease